MKHISKYTFNFNNSKLNSLTHRFIFWDRRIKATERKRSSLTKAARICLNALLLCLNSRLPSFLPSRAAKLWSARCRSRLSRWRLDESHPGLHSPWILYRPAAGIPSRIRSWLHRRQTSEQYNRSSTAKTTSKRARAFQMAGNPKIQKLWTACDGFLMREHVLRVDRGQ